jgi:hypothetical protein
MQLIRRGVLTDRRLSHSWNRQGQEENLYIYSISSNMQLIRRGVLTDRRLSHSWNRQRQEENVYIYVALEVKP